MCVICVKPVGVELPKREIIDAMYMANSDGCGFCTQNMYYRGLTYNEFMNNIKKVKKSDACIMHFRLATHGSVKESNCHPFYDEETGVYFAHNGVLPIKSVHDMTDSEIAFREMLVPCIKRYGFASSQFEQCADRLADGYSRFAFLQGKKIMMTGDYVQYNGLYFSNTRFMYYVHQSFSSANEYYNKISTTKLNVL